jgi:hypothetical protein
MAALALGGWLADHTQIRSVMLLASLIHIAIGVVLWSLPRLRHFHLTADCEEDRS